MKYAIVFAAAALVAVSAAVAGEKAADDKSKGMDHAAMEAKMNEKMEAHFKEVDANSDGKITEQELVDYVTAKAKAEFASMAGDDAAVTLDEMKAHHKAKHDEMMKEHMSDDAAKEEHKH
ncbi:MAG: hypothetical protein A3E78_13505 [Alphaproteobacteria bacterium RIFCSPHIGHO2_12_FULL_63_12]|nr:MAG: hypothetical protein A3E78_13505 [Alphaproteobacteria bacterium RIFCSPHIGHO2_12_FULL_63_12]